MNIHNDAIVVQQSSGDEKKVDIQHLEAGNFGDVGDKSLSLDAAIAADHAEHEMGILAALRQYKAAVFWSVVVSMCIVMEGYDLNLLGNLMAQPAFRERFGEYVNEASGYQISAPWQTGTSQAATCGAFFGVLFCGWITNKIGYKKTILGALIAMTGAIFLPFFAESLAVLLVGEFMCGVPWGVFSVIAPSYASEVAPLPLRHICTIYVQICWCIGTFVASGVLFGVNEMTTKWAYKIPFAVQWAWPVPLFILILFAPESPWWLIRKGRLEDAERVVCRLGGSTKQVPRDVVALMLRTHQLELATTSGATYLDCFKGTDLRRTIITCAIHAYANFTGLLIGNLGTYFFLIAGLPSEKAFALGLGETAIQFVAVMCAWFLASRFGRRTLYLWGIAFNGTMLLLIGILGCVPQSEGVSWAMGILVILLYLQYGLTLGPMCYAVMGEASSIRLRAQTISLSRDFYYIVAIITGIINTYMLNPSAWNLQGKAGFVFCGTCAFVWVTAYFGLPEFKGRSFRELDIMFHRRVPARKFKSTVIDDQDEL